MNNTNKHTAIFAETSSEVSHFEPLQASAGGWAKTLRSGEKATAVQQVKPCITKVEKVHLDIHTANPGTGRRTGDRPGPISSKGVKGSAGSDLNRPGPSSEGMDLREDEVLEISDREASVHDASDVMAEEQKEEGDAQDDPCRRKQTDTGKKKIIIRTSDSELEEEEFEKKRGRSTCPAAVNYISRRDALIRLNEEKKKAVELQADDTYWQLVRKSTGIDARECPADIDLDINWDRDEELVKGRIAEAPTGDIAAELYGWLDSVRETAKKSKNLKGGMKKVLNLAHRVGSAAVHELSKRALGEAFASPIVVPTPALSAEERNELGELRREVVSLRRRLEELERCPGGTLLLGGRIPGSPRSFLSPRPRFCVRGGD